MLSISNESRPNRRGAFVSLGLHLAAVAALVATAAAPPMRSQHLRATFVTVARLRLPAPDLSVPRPAAPARAPRKAPTQVATKALPAMRAQLAVRPSSAPARQPLAAPELELHIETAGPQAPALAAPAEPKPPAESSPALTGFDAARAQRDVPINMVVSTRFGSASPGASFERTPSARAPAGFSAGQAKLAAAGARRAASAGFADAESSSGSLGPPLAQTKPAGFVVAVAGRNNAEPRLRQRQEPVERPPKILAKPRPEYTDAARAKKVEGDAVLEVLLASSGEARVLRVIEGLGYGLDECAVKAANEIRFEPAVRDGRPVDSVVTMRIRFELAL